MFIYLDTMLWNKLCDQGTDASELVSTLSKRGSQLVLGTQSIYEMAKTFGSPSGDDRGRQLFSYLQTYAELGIPCIRPNPYLLRSEAASALNRDEPVEPFLGGEDHGNMREAIEKLSKGILEPRANWLIRDRNKLAASERSAMAIRYAIPSKLKVTLASVSPADLDLWMRKEAQRSGRMILRQHVQKQFPDLPQHRQTLLAKKLLSSPHGLLSQAVVRADLYANWRAARNGSISRDLLPDLDHVVTAAYCDVYATMEAAQGKYAPLILRKNTTVAIYDGADPLSSWLPAQVRRLAPSRQTTK